MNEVFIRKNEIGVDIEYYIIAKVNDEYRDYIIYTDLVKDELDMFRLYVDMVNNDSYVPVSDTRKELILDKFRNEISSFYNNLMGDDK